jgi:hypothetical protein
LGFDSHIGVGFDSFVDGGGIGGAGMHLGGVVDVVLLRPERGGADECDKDEENGFHMRRVFRMVMTGVSDHTNLYCFTRTDRSTGNALSSGEAIIRIGCDGSARRRHFRGAHRPRAAAAG